jgi:hypothetical protein
MHGEDGSLHLSMAQELLIRKLEVPMHFDAPPWVERERHDESGTTSTTTSATETDGTA